jgi:flagellar basal-body rod modification protein FlgD
MPVNSINNTASEPWNAANSASVLPDKTLNQDDFLKLLVAQMTSQDPMNPQSNTDFAAQMAQFSALQTSQKTESEMAKLQANQQIEQANGLLGRNVIVRNGDGISASGTVSAVQISAGTPRILINGVAYDLSQVLSIQATASTTAPAPQSGTVPAKPPMAPPPAPPVVQPPAQPVGQPMPRPIRDVINNS